VANVGDPLRAVTAAEIVALAGLLVGGCPLVGQFGILQLHRHDAFLGALHPHHYSVRCDERGVACCASDKLDRRVGLSFVRLKSQRQLPERFFDLRLRRLAKRALENLVF
jgi:hypothetical protein